MEAILQKSLQIPSAQVYLPYGTAGFRTVAHNLPQACFRVGLLALLRSHELKKITGVMITASHNHIADNGIKMIDHNGEMVPIAWERAIEAFVNAQDFAEVLREKFSNPIQGDVFIGCDNRPSSPELLSCLQQAIEVAGGTAHNYGELTTPQLHWLVRRSNFSSKLPASAYIDYLNQASRLYTSLPQTYNYENDLIIDASGGVGANTLRLLNITGLNFQIVNTEPSLLNEGCGAEHAHKIRTCPRNVPVGLKCASLDGDADRLVYYKSAENLNVLGGERLTVLMCLALKKLLDEENVEGKVTVVTTGYSNSASLEYLEQRGIEIVLVATGVKYLHEAAKKAEISVYFEANGHGTIIASENKLASLKELNAEKLLAFLSLANEAVGDAVADLLLSEISMKILDFSLKQWEELYHDYPTTIIGVRSPIKEQIKTSENELEVVEPANLVNKIQEITHRLADQKVRVLLRPSGTEPIVRIFVEALSLDTCKAVANELREFII
ncbi:PGM3 [Blepharisma stoltei]|uniref:phosphoacetylglucosamine mutase n=1 Tax=Blepharisma stoltei TaxID=1481888 RepID=A0AAU9J084_9CILI|nr:unnamed protein product [Blepharisma stoltei]